MIGQFETFQWSLGCEGCLQLLVAESGVVWEEEYWPRVSEPEEGGEGEGMVLNVLVYKKLLLPGELFAIYLKALASPERGDLPQDQ